MKQVSLQIIMLRLKTYSWATYNNYDAPHVRFVSFL